MTNRYLPVVGVSCSVIESPYMLFFLVGEDLKVEGMPIWISRNCGMERNNKGAMDICDGLMS